MREIEEFRRNERILARGETTGLNDPDNQRLVRVCSAPPERCGEGNRFPMDKSVGYSYHALSGYCKLKILFCRTYGAVFWIGYIPRAGALG